MDNNVQLDLLRKIIEIKREAAASRAELERREELENTEYHV